MSLKKQYFPPGKNIWLRAITEKEKKSNPTLGNPNQIFYSHPSSLRLYDVSTQTHQIRYVAIQKEKVSCTQNRTDGTAQAVHLLQVDSTLKKQHNK